MGFVKDYAECGLQTYEYYCEYPKICIRRLKMPNLTNEKICWLKCQKVATLYLSETFWANRCSSLNAERLWSSPISANGTPLIGISFLTRKPCRVLLFCVAQPGKRDWKSREGYVRWHLSPPRWPAFVCADSFSVDSCVLACLFQKMTRLHLMHPYIKPTASTFEHSEPEIVTLKDDHHDNLPSESGYLYT